MGGSGSGRPGYRATVEGCLKLDINAMQSKGALVPFRSGSWVWSQAEERIATIGYEVSVDGYSLTLSYGVGSGDERESVNYSLRLEKTPAHFGGYRYWVYCPLVGCKSWRLSKLYLPSGGKYFGCRQCYRLTYESCNESHKFDSMFKRIAVDTGVSPEIVKRALSEGF